MLGFYLLVYGAPFLLAATPGWIAFGNRRRNLGIVLLVGAVFAVVSPVYLDHLALVEAAERGQIRDDIAFMFMPALFGTAYALVAGAVLVAFVIVGRLRR